MDKNGWAKMDKAAEMAKTAGTANMAKMVEMVWEGPTVTTHSVACIWAGRKSLLASK